MSAENILKIAETFEKLVSKGEHPYKQIGRLKDSANMLRMLAPLFETAALGHYDPEDIYEEDTEAPARAEKAKNAIKQINEIAAYVQHKGYKEGLSATDAMFYKNKLKGLLAELEEVPKYTYKKIDPMMISALTNFGRDLNNWRTAGFGPMVPSAAPQKEPPYEEQMFGKRKFHEPVSHEEYVPGPWAEGEEFLGTLYE